MVNLDESTVARSLVDRIHCGDRAAEAELFVRYGPPVLLMLRAISHCRAAAEDAHQETFAVVLQRLRRLPLAAPEQLGPFVHRTARNVLMASSRKRRRRERFEASRDVLEALADPAPGQLARIIAQERNALVRRSIAGIRPARYRQLLSRYYLDGEDRDTICAELGLTCTHFNRVIFRARRRLLLTVERELNDVRAGGVRSQARPRQ